MGGAGWGVDLTPSHPTQFMGGNFPHPSFPMLDSSVPFVENEATVDNITCQICHNIAQ